ncbi:hypothetical protein ATJ93_4766 [Halopiger aswanensis]|uniref:Uncharacterized protein n=1 Tax=Halopiger aswanensis TaxID=148449 RepID=A0A419VUK8_9EURY|nr:hypothetical protein ATJ93_4766 [Halopiger aswanensis]
MLYNLFNFFLWNLVTSLSFPFLWRIIPTVKIFLVNLCFQNCSKQIMVKTLPFRNKFTACLSINGYLSHPKTDILHINLYSIRCTFIR